MGLRTGISIGMVAVACSCFGLASGCGQKDTGQVVNETAADIQKSRAEAAQKIREVQNNPNIPPAQKQAIIGRLQGQAGGGTSETAARNAVAPKVGVGGNK